MEGWILIDLHLQIYSNLSKTDFCQQSRFCINMCLNGTSPCKISMAWRKSAFNDVGINDFLYMSTIRDWIDFYKQMYMRIQFSLVYYVLPFRWSCSASHMCGTCENLGEMTSFLYSRTSQECGPRRHIRRPPASPVAVA